MDKDLSPLLLEWPYDGADPVRNIRRASGIDGRAIIQVREPLGIQQMDYLGRPDGLRPNGYETWLNHYEVTAEDNLHFGLSHDDCLRLIQEGILFYQRYLILYQMEDWEGVARDTDRNLHYFDFVNQHAENTDDSLTIEQYRPYVIRMNAVAHAHLLWGRSSYDESIELLRGTIDAIEALEAVPSNVFKLEREKSTIHLKELIEEFEGRRPQSELDRLRREKTDAIRREDFELAAEIRDRIRLLEGEFSRSN